MWRWTGFLCLLIFYGHCSSQPVADDSENVRQTRQLDFGECCPCPGSGQGLAAQESSMLGEFARSRDIDDCPCRPRSADSEGASSMFFPTSRRSDEFSRPADKNEDIKPLLHPEVDLASSVLQTLREATEEEYEEALARDAARSMAKAAEETIFGDALPEASNGNIVTIIVNPKEADSFEDGIPQASHIKESRCVHAPLESGSPNLSQMRVAQKPPNLLRDIFGLPRMNKPAGLLHKNLLDMDNGASNIQERVAQVNDGQTTNKSGPVLRKYSPFMKFDKNLQDKSTNLKSNVDVNTGLKKVPDFKLPPLKKLKDLVPNRTALEGKENANSLPLIPKMRFNNPLLKLKGKENPDLSLSASNIHEQAKKSFFQTKSHLENLLQNTKPVGLKTLLKLKDVEFVPLKDLIPKATERSQVNKPKLAWPDIFNKEDKVKSQNNIARSTEILETIPKSRGDENLDADVSPSNVIEQINDDNCINRAFKTTEIDDKDDIDSEVNATLSDTIDAASSPSEIQEVINDTSNDLARNDSNEQTENTDYCNINTLADTETNNPQLIENSSGNEPMTNNDINNEDELNFVTSKEVTPDDAKADAEDSESEFISNDEDCNKTNDGDLMTDSSNNGIDILKPTDEVIENMEDSIVNQTQETQEPCSEEVPTSDTSNILDINPKKLIKPLSLDKTLSTIKENIRKHIEGLQIPKTKNVIDQPTPNNFEENKESSQMIEKLDSDCLNEEAIHPTTVKPDNCDEDLKIKNLPKNDEVSMQDLQKISDNMLQEEKERKSKTLSCNEPNQDVTDSKVPMQENSVENENIDSETSPNTQDEVVMDPQNEVDFSDNNGNDEKNACKTDLMSPKQSFEKEPDANVAASEVIMRMMPNTKNNDFSLNIPLPTLNEIKFSPLPTLDEIKLAPLPTLDEIKLAPLPTFDEIKLAPLPTLDEIKLGLTNLFDTPAQKEEKSALEAESLTDSSNILAPVMSTDASVKHFQSLLPPLRLEDVDLDILRLNPQPNLFSNIPKLDLHSFRTKLPLPVDLRIKPLKLQSAFEDNGGLFGATLSLGQNNPLEIPSLDSLGSQIKSNSKKLAKTFRKPETLRLKSSQGIGELTKIRGAITKPVNLQSTDLLGAISRNHEDFSDKLKALHMDFNDRLETMRNNLFDKSIFGSGELSSTKSFSTFSTKDKKSKFKTSQPQSLSSRRESKKTSKPLRQKESRLESSHGLQNKFKMPTSASVPVPRTVEVPELKATLTKSPGLGIHRSSGVNPIFLNVEASQPKESTLALWKQASKKLPMPNTRLGKTMNPFKDSKINISFSTTPRPSLQNRLQSRKLSAPSLTLGKNTGRLGQRIDHRGSSSDMKHSITSPPISSQLDEQKLGNYGMKSESRQTGVLKTRKFAAKDNVEQPKLGKDLQSWPKVSESAFLSKVKEAVKARMSKVNSPASFKKLNEKSMGSSVIENGDVPNSNTDMARSATTNIDVIEGNTLKENVSYKCTMVCTRE